MFTCDICNYTTKYKSNYNKHLNRKIPCKPINPEKPYSCLYCNITFTNRKNKYKHQIVCPMNVKNTQNKLNELNNSYCQLHNEIKELKTLISNNSKKNIEVNNYYLENNIEILINCYGNENRDYITDTYMSKLLELPFGAIKKYVKQLHFNPEHPENNNMKITNKKQPYIYTYNNNKWSIKDKADILEDIVDNSYIVIDEHYEYKESYLSDKLKYRYKNFQDKYKKKDKILKKQLLKDVELTILNK